MDSLPFFFNHLFTEPYFFLPWVLIITFSICVHEYAHAITALLRGDDTAARQGHLTLNPLVQMGPVSLMLLLIAGIAWGAVPVDVSRFRRRSDASLVALAGPLANLLLAIVFALGVLVTRWVTGGLEGNVVYFLFLAIRANTVLFLFNMLPIPILDGWKVYAQWFPPMRNLSPVWSSQISLMLFMLLWVTPAVGVIWNWGDHLAAIILSGWLLLGGVG